MENLPRANSLRVLCLDGGGIKGYTSLIILKRILRTMKEEGGLAAEPYACEVFDLITGTSTGGLIAVMLGRMGMSTDEAMRCYETMGGQIFGSEPSGGKLGRLMKGIFGSPFYKIQNLQEAVRKALSDNGIDKESDLLEEQPAYCKIMLCVTRQSVGKADVLRNYTAAHPTQENYKCSVWEAASATAAAPMYFEPVKFKEGGETWCDGGLRRNNPINEALAEIARERPWQDKEIGCVLSIGTGVPKLKEVSKDLAGFLKGSIAIMTDSEEIADVFAHSHQGSGLAQSNRYFRFSVPQGVSDLHLDEWKATEKMKSLTNDYLRKYGSGTEVERCATSLLDPDRNLQAGIQPLPSIIPHKNCVSFITRSTYFTELQKFFRTKAATHHAFVLWGLGGTGKTQIALHFAHWVKNRFSVFWIRADSFTNFAHDFSAIESRLTDGTPTAGMARDQIEVMIQARGQLEAQDLRWLLVLDNADNFDDFIGSETTAKSISSYLPSSGRFLITSRDPRFLGGFASAGNGRRVLPMEDVEAEHLLLRSIPKHLLTSKGNDSGYARELLEELGCLPLAIAQAAANISDQQLTLLEYVIAYRNKSERLRLLEKSTRDPHTADTRNMLQSIKVTWDLSMKYLEESHPLSALCLNYIGFWHWQDVPTELLRRLPEFNEMTPLRFRSVLRKLLHLSLVDMSGEESAEWPQLSLHPLVHRRITERIPQKLAERCLVNNVALLSKLFPRYANGYSSSQVILCTFLQSHGTTQVQFCEDLNVKSASVATLVTGLATYFRLVGLTREAARLSRKALDVRKEVSGATSIETLEARIGFITSLNADAEYGDAVAECEVMFETLRTADIDKHYIHELELETCSHAMSPYHKTGRYADAVEFARKILVEVESSPRSSRAALIVARHDLSHYAWAAGNAEEAIGLNEQVLNDIAVVAVEDPSAINLQAHMSALTLRARLLKMKQRSSSLEGSEASKEINRGDEVLRIYMEVYHRYLQDGNIWAIDLWKACNNVLAELNSVHHTVFERYEAVKTLLVEASKNPIHLQGQLLQTFRITYTFALYILRELMLEEDEGAEPLYRSLGSLLSTWSYLDEELGCDINRLDTSHIDSHNIRAVYLQQNGRFSESEKILRSLCALMETKEPSGSDRQTYDVVYYNLMLSVARQGRLEEAKMIRSQQLANIQRAEALHGDLETRMIRDQEEEAIYREAQQRLALAQSSPETMKTEEWFVEHRKTLKKTQLIYGNLEGDVAAPAVPPVVPSRLAQVTSIATVGADCQPATRSRSGQNTLSKQPRSESRFRKLIRGKRSRDATPDGTC